MKDIALPAAMVVTGLFLGWVLLQFDISPKWVAIPLGGAYGMHWWANREKV